MSESDKYGKKIEYDPLWSGPMNYRRSPTDVRFLKALGIFCIGWVLMATFVFSDYFNEIAHSNTKAYENRVKRDTSLQEANSDDMLRTIIFSIVISALLSLVYIMLLRWSARIIAYTIIVLILVILFVSICATVSYYAKEQQPELLATIFVSTLIFIVLVILFIWNRKRIDIACEVIKEASKCVSFFPSSFVFPLLPVMALVVVLVFGGAVLVRLEIIYPSNYERPLHIYLFHFYNIFGLFWLICFITGFSEMVLSGTFATWFWTRNKMHVPSFTIVYFMKITVKNHLGTVAFGSLILAICGFIKMLFNNNQNQTQSSSCSWFSFGWLNYLCENLTSFIKYINRNVYIMSAVHGTKFMRSAKDAFHLLFRNAVKCITIIKVTDAIFIGGHLLIMCLTLSWAIYYFPISISKLNDSSKQLLIGSVSIASLAMSSYLFMVLRIAVDTIFLCILEDYERNDGSDERPYYMSFQLKKLFFEEAVGV